MKKIVNIGLDIGVASCGWSIIDDDGNLIDFGVRLFDEPCDRLGKLKNEKRRTIRSMRRRIRRARMRKLDLFKLFQKYSLIDANIGYDKFVEKINNISGVDRTEPTMAHLKAKGLKEKLPEPEMVACLFHYIHHRGYFHVDEELFKKVGLSETYSSNDLFPSEQQKKFFDEKKYYVGREENANISNERFIKEVSRFLIVQQLDEKFCDEYKKLLCRARNFATGPGSQKSPTPFGLWRKKGNEVVKIGENLWDVAVGKCSVYNDQLRGGKKSPIAEVYDLLSKLSALYFDDPTKLEKSGLSAQIKGIILDEFSKTSFKKKEDISKKILEIIQQNYGENVDFKSIRGWTPDKNNQPLFLELTNTVKIIRWLKKCKVEKAIDIKKIDDLKRVNRVFEILAKTAGSNDFRKKIEDIQKEYSEYEISVKTVQTLLNGVTGVSQTSRLSYKAMLEYIEKSMLPENCRLQPLNLFSEKIKKNDPYNFLFSGKKYIPIRDENGESLLGNEIVSPTALRAFLQAVKIINRILKKIDWSEHQLNNIVIEMAREKNSAEERKKIKKAQDESARKVEEILKAENLEAGCNIQDTIKELSYSKKEKIILWNEQQGCDIFTGKKIDLRDLINNSRKYNIEHVIPWSRSFDNSRINKVLAFSDVNANKADKTPLEWLSTERVGGYKNRVENFYGGSDDYSKAKKKRLLTEEIDSDFIGRNLVDTRYACRCILSVLQNFFRINECIHGPVKIKVIKGCQTSYARNRIFKSWLNSHQVVGIKKDRDEYVHHAIDATIVAFLGSHGKISKKIYAYERWIDNKFSIDEETGEVHRDYESSKLFSQEEFQQIDELSRQMGVKKCKFSKQIVWKSNLSLFNENPWSMRCTNGEVYKVSKIDLFDKSEKFSDYFGDKAKHKDKLLCKDEPLYDKLNTIYNSFKESKHPFLDYMEEYFRDENVKKIAESDIGCIDQDKDSGEKDKGNIGLPKPRHLIIRDDEKNSIRYVRHLRYLAEKRPKACIFLSSHNNKAFFDSLNSLETRIYLVRKNGEAEGIKCVPINSLFLKEVNKKLVCDEEELRRWLEERVNDPKKAIKIDTDRYIRIVRGQPLIDKNDRLFWFLGSSDYFYQNMEIKPMFCTTKKYFQSIDPLSKQDRMKCKMSRINQDYQLCRLSELGDVYDRCPIFNKETGELGGGIYSVTANVKNGLKNNWNKQG